jgi:hypothetical protein
MGRELASDNLRLSGIQCCCKIVELPFLFLDEKEPKNQG